MNFALTPNEVQNRFGSLFSKRFITIVDEKNKIVEIIEECSARGPIEWDAVNRARAGGVAKRVWTEGATMYLHARIGNEPVSFGPADAEMGGQALEGVEVLKDEVCTRWAGVAGAGLGIAACLPQAQGVMKVIYPDEETLKRIGGAHVVRVTLVTPRMEKVIVGIDDTDTKEKGATWAFAFKAAREAASMDGVEFLEHRIVQLNPQVFEKTTNCVSTALCFAARPDCVKDLINFLHKRLREMAVSNNAHMAVWRQILIPEELRMFGRRAKGEILKIEEAEHLVSKLGMEHLEISGKRGLIGAMAAIAYSDSGVEAAALEGDRALRMLRR